MRKKKLWKRSAHVVPSALPQAAKRKISCSWRWRKTTMIVYSRVTFTSLPRYYFSFESAPPQ